MQKFFTYFAGKVSGWVGHPFAFIAAALFVIIWAVTGPLFHFSDTWQLVINTSTTIITFLMVFVIQNSQNRDGAAMQAKLDELLRAVDKARGSFIGIEHLTEEQICKIRTALERETGNRTDKAGTADETVERLLDRS